MPTVADIAKAIDAELLGDGERVISGVAGLELAGPAEATYYAAERFSDEASLTKAGALIVQRNIPLESPPPCPRLIVKDAELAMALLLELLAPADWTPQSQASGVSPTAQIAKDVVLGPGVSIGARSRIGAGCVLHANVVIGDDVVLGDHCQLLPNVTIYSRCTLGDRVILHAGAVIGADGFGYKWDGKKHRKLMHIGGVSIGDDVEIGANTCIDRGKFGQTVVGSGTKIDNLVQLGHNVRTGMHCILCGQVGIAGTTTLGNGVIMAGGSSAKDHIHIGDGARAGGLSGIAEDVPAGMTVVGAPAVPYRDFLREQASLRRLPEMVKELRELQDVVETLRAKIDAR